MKNSVGVLVLAVWATGVMGGMILGDAVSAESAETGKKSLCVKVGNSDCAGVTGPVGAPGVPGREGAIGERGAPAVTIVASPPVIRPGTTTDLLAVVPDVIGNPFTYKWSAKEGAFSITDTNPTLWTAPDIVGSYIVGVEVQTGSETVTGYGSVMVSVMPAGPIITQVSPAEAKAGAEIVITGVGFGNTQAKNLLHIGGLEAARIVMWSDTEILAIVPSGAVTGLVKATVSGMESSPGRLVILWDKENPENVAVSTGATEHHLPQIASDGKDGAMIVWQDDNKESGTDNDIYAQHINSLGKSLWNLDGVAISTAADHQSEPRIVADGTGGAIIVWQDARTGRGLDIYAQRVNTEGKKIWAEKGVAVVSMANDQFLPRLISDGAEGAIMIWQDFRTGAPHLYGQRISAEGKALWAANGVPVSVAANGQSAAQIVPDGTGGAIVAWQDFRNGKHNDIYAQRIGGDGAAQWTENGVALSTAISDQVHPAIIGDGTGGATVAWEDLRGGVSHIYAQRVNDKGAIQWAQDGIVISHPAEMQSVSVPAGHPMKAAMTEPAPKGESNPQIIADQLGGTMITWQDARSGTSDIYAQRVNGAGQVQWTENGIAIAHAAQDQALPHMISDGFGGVIISWDDYRSGTASDVYAQRLNNAGKAQWTYNGIAVSTAKAGQSAGRMIADGSGGAMVTWQDARGKASNVYVQKVSGGGLQ